MLELVCKSKEPKLMDPQPIAKSLTFVSLLHLDAALRQHAELQVDHIFFESSVKKSFASPEEKIQFKYKYLDVYKQKECTGSLNHFYVALDSTHQIQGYICGTEKTSECREILKLHPWMNQLSELFDSYPSHLHINCGDKSRGQGLGSKLLTFFENQLLLNKVAGVHLVTAVDAKNVSFYDKNGYSFRYEFLIGRTNNYLLGKKLNLSVS